MPPRGPPTAPRTRVRSISLRAGVIGPARCPSAGLGRRTAVYSWVPLPKRVRVRREVTDPPSTWSGHGPRRLLNGRPANARPPPPPRRLADEGEQDDEPKRDA